jgi:hypothetical protein
MVKALIGAVLTIALGAVVLGTYYRGYEHGHGDGVRWQRKIDKEKVLEREIKMLKAFKEETEAKEAKEKASKRRGDDKDKDKGPWKQ